MFTHAINTHQLHTFVCLSTLLHKLVHPNTQPRHSVKYPHIAVFTLFFAQWGLTALLRAACYGHAEVVRMLLDCVSALNEVDNVSVYPAPMSTDSVWIAWSYNTSTAVEATDVSGLHWEMYCGMCSIWCKCMDWLYDCQISCSQDGWTAVLGAADGGHLDLVRELVEQHRADLLHKSKVSSASFCVWFRLILWVTSVMCTCRLCDSSH